MPTSCASGRASSRRTHCEPQPVSDCLVLFFVFIGQSDLVVTHLDICWCSPLVIGCIPPPPLVEQPLANTKMTASPKQRLILVMMLYFIFIIVSFFLLICFFLGCGRSAGHGLWVENLRAFQRHGANGRLNQSRTTVRSGFN